MARDWKFLLFIIIYGGFAQAQLSTRLNTTNSVLLEKHCECRTITNSTGKDLYIPHRTLAEWTAFINNPPAGVNVSTTCLGSAGGNLPAFDVQDISTSNSCAHSNKVVVSGTSQNGLQAVYVELHHPNTQAGCNFSIYKNGLQFATFSTTATFNVCESDELQLRITCDGLGSYSGAIRFYKTNASGTIIDDVAYSLGTSSCPL